jgi:hypothetical protein
MDFPMRIAAYDGKGGLSKLTVFDRCISWQRLSTLLVLTGKSVSGEIVQQLYLH